MDQEYISHSEKYDEELLSEGMIANARLLSNDKYEFDSIMMLFSERLKIIPNGKYKISKMVKIKCFNDRYVYRMFLWPIKYKGFKDDFRNSISELSKVITYLFSYRTNDREYNGLEQVINHGHRIEIIGTGLNQLVNDLYTLMISYTKYFGEFATPNDLMYKDMISNMQMEPSLYNIDLEAFNLARLLLVVSDNLPDINYTKTLLKKESIVNHRRYNNCGDYVVLNDLLYAGKYGKAACQYSKIFDSYVGYQGAYDELLRHYDNVVDRTNKGRYVDKKDVKEIIRIVYLYYGSKYLRMKENNALDKKGLEIYKKRVMKAFNSVMKQYDIKFDSNELLSKAQGEKIIEYNFLQDSTYYKLTKTKESFEPHEKVPMEANNSAREIRLKYNLGE